MSTWEVLIFFLQQVNNTTSSDISCKTKFLWLLPLLDENYLKKIKKFVEKRYYYAMSDETAFDLQFQNAFFLSRII